MFTSSSIDSSYVHLYICLLFFLLFSPFKLDYILTSRLKVKVRKIIFKMYRLHFDILFSNWQ